MIFVAVHDSPALTSVGRQQYLAVTALIQVYFFRVCRIRNQFAPPIGTRELPQICLDMHPIFAIIGALVKTFINCLIKNIVHYVYNVRILGIYGEVSVQFAGKPPMFTAVFRIIKGVVIPDI